MDWACKNELKYKRQANQKSTVTLRTCLLCSSSTIINLREITYTIVELLWLFTIVKLWEFWAAKLYGYHSLRLNSSGHPLKYFKTCIILMTQKINRLKCKHNKLRTPQPMSIYGLPGLHFNRHSFRFGKEGDIFRMIRLI